MHTTDQELGSALQRVPSRYGTMFVFTADTFLCRSLIEYGEWAQAEIALLLDILEPESVAVDVGAFIGTHTLAFANKLKDKGRVYAIEPHPVYFGVLDRNLRTNSAHNVQPLNIGLSDHACILGITKTKFQGSNNFGHTTLEALDDPAGQFQIDVRTLDQLSLPRCDLIKIDAEGMEHQILSGAIQMLMKQRPTVYAECNSVAEGWLVVQLMTSQRYEASVFIAAAYNANNHRNNPLNIFDDAREVGLLFVPSEKRKLLAKLGEKHQVLAPVSKLDDLVLGLLKKPQYKYEVLSRTAAADAIGRDFWLNEPETQALKKRFSEADADLSDLRRDLVDVQGIAMERFGDIQELSSRLDQTNAALSIAQKLAHERAAQLDAISSRLTDTDAALSRVQALAHARADQVAELTVRLDDTQAALFEAQELIQERADEQSRISQQLDKTNSALTETQELAHSRADEIKGLVARLDHTQATLLEAQKLAHERADQLIGVSQQLDKTNAALLDAQVLAHARADQISLLSGRVDIIQSALLEVQELAHQRANQIEDLASRLAKTDSALSEAQGLAGERAGQLTKLSQQLDRTNAALTDVQALAHARADQVAELTARLDGTEAALLETQKLAQERGIQTEELSIRLQETGRALSDTQQVAAERANEIAGLSNRLNTSAAALSEANARLSEQSSQIHDLMRSREQLHSIVSSRLWRCTKPLRLLGKAIARAWKLFE